MATFRGDEESNILTGTNKADKIWGEGGNDTITGGKGNDKLEGGAGKDTFVFGEKSGKDVITDFDVKKDVLEIAKGLNGIKKAKDVLKHADQKGKDVVIDLGDGNKITLKNVDIDDLKKNPGDHFDIVS
jgi:Ca2+-binding RTX toxin-like protein